MSTDSSNPQPPPFVANGSAKRRKVERACDRCKSRKRRCDGNQPCFLCQKSQALCKYGATQVRLSRSGGRTSRQADRHSAALNDSLSPTVVTAAPFNNQNVNNQNVVQSSRATTPGGEGDGFVQAGQYLGPTSTFSVSLPFRMSELYADSISFCDVLRSVLAEPTTLERTPYTTQPMLPSSALGIERSLMTRSPVACDCPMQTTWTNSCLAILTSQCLPIAFYISQL